MVLLHLPSDVLARALSYLPVRCVVTSLEASRAWRGLRERADVWLPLCRTLRSAKNQQRASKRLRHNAFGVYVREARAERERRERALLMLTSLARRAAQPHILAKLRAALKQCAGDGFDVDWTSRGFGGNTVLNAFAAYSPFFTAAAAELPRSPGSCGDLRPYLELLKRGADANLGDLSGFTPLMHAAAHGNAALVELLLAHGARAATRGSLTADSIVSYTRVSGVARPCAAPRWNALEWATHYGGGGAQQLRAGHARCAAVLRDAAAAAGAGDGDAGVGAQAARASTPTHPYLTALCEVVGVVAVETVAAAAAAAAE